LHAGRNLPGADGLGRFVQADEVGEDFLWQKRAGVGKATGHMSGGAVESADFPAYISGTPLWQPLMSLNLTVPTEAPAAGLTSEDLAPVTPAQRTWGTWNYAALWVSMSLCIPTYMMASSLIGGGMSWWQALLTIFLGNSIVLVPMLLNGRAGARYGIPFPVFARASFGVRGANVPALLRAIIACGWFGIQTWIGGYALYQMGVLWWPGLATLPAVFPASWGLATGPALTFLLFWAVNMYVVKRGVDSIRRLLVFKAFFLPLAALALLVWAIGAGNGLGPILAQPAKFPSSAAFWAFFFPSLTGMVGFWATLSLNIPDFTRYAVSQRAQQLGQAIGLPTSMTLFSFVGVVVTSATFIIYGETIWDPVVLAGKFDSKLLVSFAMLAVALSTLATNTAANIVSPANDFANLDPTRISFRTGGYITGVIGLLIFPWKLIADPSGYVFTWLVGYSGLLGPIGGIMIVDYYLLRGQQLNVPDLYQYEGRYTYRNGYNPAALLALVAGVLPVVPGFLVAIGVLEKAAVWPWLTSLYNYAWFVGFAVAGGVYRGLMGRTTRV
jgi:NCS1 family nucleobase:cation symporter-1